MILRRTGLWLINVTSNLCLRAWVLVPMFLFFFASIKSTHLSPVIFLHTLFRLFSYLLLSFSVYMLRGGRFVKMSYFFFARRSGNMLCHVNKTLLLFAWLMKTKIYTSLSVSNWQHTVLKLCLIIHNTKLWEVQTEQASAGISLNVIFNMYISADVTAAEKKICQHCKTSQIYLLLYIKIL